MMTLASRWKVLKQVVAQAAESDFARQVRATLAQDLPAWLLELGVLTPVEVREIGAGLARELAQLARVCGEERQTLHDRGTRSPLALKLSLDRVAGALAPLEATLSRSALALRRSDPHLPALGTAASVATTSAEATRASAPSPTSGPLIALSERDCRKLAETLRGGLREAEHAARNILATLQSGGLSGTVEVAGAIEQTRTLVAWLRQERERATAQLVRQPLAGFV